MKKYIVNFQSQDKFVEFPDDAELTLESIKAGDQNSSITVLYVRQGNTLLAAYVGVMHFYPVELEGQTRNWARD